jgi:hypothetical protein
MARLEQDLPGLGKGDKSKVAPVLARPLRQEMIMKRKMDGAAFLSGSWPNVCNLLNEERRR